MTGRATAAHAGGAGRTSWTATGLLALLLGCPLLGCPLLGCQGGFGDGPTRPKIGGAPDDVVITPDCHGVATVLNVLEPRCATAGCHHEGGQFPNLTRSGLSDLAGLHSEGHPDEILVVPGSPEQSWLYRKMTGAQGDEGGALMPLGTTTPIAEVATLEAWILAGAPSECEGGLDPSPLPPDPNALDQETLFTCTAPATSSPARIRRIERKEWTHAVGREITSVRPDNARNNPLETPTDLEYSTYSYGVTIDPATLELYMLNLPEATAPWSARDRGPRTYAVYGNRDISCIFNQAMPDDACIDYYLDQYFAHGNFFRAPTESERGRLRQFLVEALREEGGDTALRSQTLAHVGSAAWMMSGALFWPEVGEPVDGDALGRNRLTNDELALALGRVLSTHPVGSALPYRAAIEGHPDFGTPEYGWLGQIRQAADDGSIQDPEVLRELVATYAGGVDATRLDLQGQYATGEIERRGEYYLAPRVADFFREWLGYEGATTAFKEAPAATSLYEDNVYADRAFTNLQNSGYGAEATLVQQLDDTIARVVVETANGGGDVFRELLTTRLWRLPSNIAYSSDQPCSTSDECVPDNIVCDLALHENPLRGLCVTSDGVPGPMEGAVCRYETDCVPTPSCTSIGLCSSTIAGGIVETHRVFGLTENVPATPEGRWVEVPPERAGVLTHPAWLAAHGANFEDDASAVHRGRWIREHLFCESVPGLELVMVEAMLVPSDPELSARERMVQSFELVEDAPTCMGCHRLMNPLGMPFEIYNHAGYLRATDHGSSPDGRSVLMNAPDPFLNREYTDAVDLTIALAESGYARRCFIRQAFRFFMGRDETMADACTLAEMESAMETGSFTAVLQALVTSDTFRYRHVEGGGQ